MWELGEIQRDSWAPRFWSNASCLFHHAYPVGFRASKRQSQRDFDMAVVQGQVGPDFTVGSVLKEGEGGCAGGLVGQEG